MVRYHKSTFFGLFFFVSFLFFTSGCSISDGVEGSYTKSNTSRQEPTTTSAFGLTAAGGTRTSGNYSVEGAIGDNAPSILRSQGTYKVYGGIQGQVVSR